MRYLNLVPLAAFFLGCALQNAAAQQPRTILAIGAHAGDAELTSGPLLAAERARGSRIVILDLTLGEKGHPTLTPEQYGAQKRSEAERVAQALGAQVGSSRTAAQTLMAGFYSANPVVFYNTGLRVISTNEALSPADQARLFAMTSMASADALINCWANKKVWYAWRPQTAIREAAS